MYRTPFRRATVAVTLAVALATGAAACSSTTSTPATTTTAGGSGGSGGSTIPAAAFSDHTGVTATQIRIGNVSTLLDGLFKGAQVGTQAYVDEVNASGGVDGRKLVLDDSDDNFTGALNKQATQNAIDQDFALVGSFSLEDSFGGALLAQHPGVPNVSVVLDQATNDLPNTYSAVPLNGGWEEGPIQYLKHRFPHTLDDAAALVADLPSAEVDWAGEKYVLQKVGFHVVYQPTYGITQTDFVQNVVAMKSMGVKILFVDSMAESFAAALLKNLAQEDFHPVVVLGAATYTNSLVAGSGGAAAVDGAVLEQNASLYLGADRTALPAVGTFLHWVDVASPGFTTDLYTLYGWLSAELFVQALRAAGPDPSRGSLLRALSHITSFDGDHIIAPNDPAAKTIGDCYLLGQVTGGQFVRMDDPPVSGPTHGYRCDYGYVSPPKG